MDHAFLVGVLHGQTNLGKQLQSCPGREAVSVAEFRDRQPVDELHDEERAACLRRSGVKDPGDSRVIHHRQGLPFGIEPCDDLLGIQSQLDDLQGHLTAHRLPLLSQVDNPAASGANPPDQSVAPDHVARPLLRCDPGAFDRRCFEETIGGCEATQERLDPGPLRGIARADALQISGSLGDGQLHHFSEDLVVGHHGFNTDCGQRNFGAKSGTAASGRWRSRNITLLGGASLR